MAAAKRHTKEETHAVSHATVSAHTVKRVFNFNAGPGALALPVLERIREELLDWRGSGMSVMEMSHRSPEFESINAAAEQKLRSLLGISEAPQPSWHLRRLCGHFLTGWRKHAVHHGSNEPLPPGKAR